jgi:alcohol dehydrogenase
MEANMKKNFDYYEPVKVIFGSGRLNEIGELAAEIGKKALIVTTGPFFIETGLVPKIQKYLQDSGIDSEVFTDVNPNPLSTQVDKGADYGRKNGCDFLIGLGGGSAIDAAKGIAVAMGHDQPIWNFCPGKQEDIKDVTDKTLPIVTITTTSGTGSHSTCFSVITNPATKEKPGLGSPNLFPKFAIVDPELMVSMPKKLTAATGFDVLTHAIEAFTSKQSTPFTDLMSEQALRLIGKYLRRACEKPEDIEARTGMALADTYSGFSIAVAVVTLCHAISHVIGGISETVHGETLAALTPHTMRYSMKYDPVKFRNIGYFLRNECVLGLSDTVTDEDLENSVKEVEKLIADTGISSSLKNEGVKKDDFKLIAEETIGYMSIGVDLDVRQANAEDIIEILKKAY